eukprot:s2571_g3.t1
MRSPAAWFCDLCGQTWEECYEPPRPKTQRKPSRRHVRAQPGSYEEQWTEYDWEGYRTDSESPRRTQANAPRQKHASAPQKQKQHNTKGEGKGSGKTTYKGKYNPDPPPWATQTTTTATAPAVTATSAASSKAEAKLQEIVVALQKKKDTLDPELQHLAQEAAVLQNQTATSRLMSAVSKHGDAKAAVLEAKQARANLHATWKQYLDSAIATWKGFLEDFDKEDRRLEENVTQAEEQLVKAKETLDTAKTLATEQELKEQVEVIEDEMEIADAGPALREGLTDMLTGLERLQEKTDEATGDQKRQRLEDGTSKPSALQPFARAGHQTS